MPPFTLDPNNPSMGLDFSEYLQDEEPTITRSADAEYGFGIPSSYQKSHDLLASEAEIAENRAMELLNRSITKSAEVTPSQGWATALLAAIPTLGGYMIGNAVGRPDIPEGAIGFDASKYKTGGAFGGLAGAQVGMSSAGGYLEGLEADRAQENEVNTKIAATELQRAGRLEQRADSLLQAGLGRQAQIDMIPLQEASQMRLQNNSAQNTMERQLELERMREQREVLPAEAERVAKAALGIPDDVSLTPAQLRSVVAAVEAGRRQQGQDIRLSGEAVSPPSAKTKEKMDSALLAKGVGDRYIQQFSSIAQQDPSLLSRTIQSYLPQTQIGELQKSLRLFAVQIRNARENGVMTEPDFQRYSSYLTLSPLDTIDSVLRRMKELQAVTNLSVEATLTAAKAGRENVSSYEKLFGFQAPTQVSGAKPISKADLMAEIQALKSKQAQ